MRSILTAFGVALYGVWASRTRRRTFDADRRYLPQLKGTLKDVERALGKSWKGSALSLRVHPGERQKGRYWQVKVNGEWQHAWTYGESALINVACAPDTGWIDSGVESGLGHELAHKVLESHGIAWEEHHAIMRRAGILWEQR